MEIKFKAKIMCKALSVLEGHLYRLRKSVNRSFQIPQELP